MHDPLIWYEGSAISNATRRYVRADPRGSIVAVTDYQGTSIATNSYDGSKAERAERGQYGFPDTATGNDISTKGRFRYTGQAWIPELGMYYYKARMYSPTLGRFLQTDPIVYEDQFNLYVYVANDPTNGVDPTGLFEKGDTLQHVNTWNAYSGGTFLGNDKKEKDSRPGQAVISNTNSVTDYDGYILTNEIVVDGTGDEEVSLGFADSVRIVLAVTSIISEEGPDISGESSRARKWQAPTQSRNSARRSS